MDQVGMYSHLDSVEMTQRCREEHGLQGIHPKNILDLIPGVNLRDMNNFIYPNNRDLAKLNLKGIYLNNYIFWDSKLQHEDMIRKNGYETRKMERTFNNYEDVGCLFANGANDYLRYFKHGFSKVSDHVAREIRLKRMTVETGKDLILNYSSKEPSDILILSDWLEISVDRFYEILHKFKNKKYFSDSNADESNYIKYLYNLDTEKLNVKELTVNDNNIEYKLTQNRELTDEKTMIMIGRVYSDKYNYGSIIDTPKGPGKLN